jgi:hypothetical protein
VKLSRISALVIMAIVLLMPVVNCESIPEVSPVRQTCIDMMQQVPIDYEDFYFWDSGMLRDDPDLRDMYEIWYERKIDYLEERYGLPASGIEYLAEGEGLLDIMKVDYDIEAFRKTLRPAFYRDTDYEAAEVWRSPPAHEPQDVTGGWVLDEGWLVRGSNNFNVDDYLSATDGRVPSQYDKNAAAVLDRLPEGVLTIIMRSTYPPGIFVSGTTFRKKTGDTLSWINVYKFESAAAADSDKVSAYFQQIEDDFKKAIDELSRRGEAQYLRDFTIERDGEFVNWSVVINIKYAISLLFYG